MSKKNKVHNENGREGHEFGTGRDDFKTSGKIQLREHDKESRFISISMAIKAMGVDRTVTNKIISLFCFKLTRTEQSCFNRHLTTLTNRSKGRGFPSFL